MKADVSRDRSNNALVAFKHRGDDDRVCLRAACDEPYVAVGAVTRRLDLLLCAVTVFIEAVSRESLKISFGKAAKDFGMSSHYIITLKIYHK